MSEHQTEPYDEQPSLRTLARDCGGVTEECTCHGISLDPPHHDVRAAPPGALHIDERTVGLLEGYEDYGD